MLGQHSELFQVAVGDVTVGVVGRDQPGLYVWWEGGPPDEGLPRGVEEDSPHACFGRICGPHKGGFFRYDLSELSGSFR